MALRHNPAHQHIDPLRPSAEVDPIRAQGASTSAEPRALPKRQNLRSIGSDGEDIALAWFIAQGYELCERNFFTRRGEIDLILRSPAASAGGQALVFVEVKWRFSDRYGMGAEAVTPEKLVALRHAALIWLSQHPEEYSGDLRFDVLDITAENITHYEGVDGW